VTRKAPAAPSPAHLLQIPPTPAAQLSTGLSWLAVVTRGRLSDRVIESALAHQRQVRTEPAVLVAAAVQFLVEGADSEPDQLNRFWHIADQISARERCRYLGLEEKDLT
jgi:hypothetical protein